jgi:extracellular solute-binding protein (family 3)
MRSRRSVLFTVAALAACGCAATPPSPAAGSADAVERDGNKRLVRELTEVVWNRRGLDRIPQFYAPDFVADYRPPPTTTRSSTSHRGGRSGGRTLDHLGNAAGPVGPPAAHRKACAVRGDRDPPRFATVWTRRCRYVSARRWLRRQDPQRRPASGSPHGRTGEVRDDRQPEDGDGAGIDDLIRAPRAGRSDHRVILDGGGVTRIARPAGVRYVLFVLALLSSAVTADAQQAPDPRVADLVRSGTLRVALFPPQVRKDPVTGESRRGAIFMELARGLAARLGVDLQLIEYRTPVEAIDGLNGGACDLAFLATDPARAADVDFSPPLSQLDFTYLVPAGSPIVTVADADRPGVRIAIVRNHGSALALGRVVKHAQLVSAEVPEAAFDLLRTGGLTPWPRPVSGCCGLSPDCRAPESWWIATAGYRTRWRSRRTSPSGSPTSASSSRRRRRQGWCSERSAEEMTVSKWRRQQVRRARSERVEGRA